MAGVTANDRSRIVLFCLGCWALGGLFIWFIAEYQAYLWASAIGSLFILIVMMFEMPFVASAAIEGRESEPEPATMPTDPLDPTEMLRHPPAGAQVASEHGRRVVVLADGSVIGELLSGRAQRFASLHEFREFVGS
jgi:hypothetical protein